MPVSTEGVEVFPSLIHYNISITQHTIMKLCTDVRLNVQIPIHMCRSAVLPLSHVRKTSVLLFDQPSYF